MTEPILHSTHTHTQRTLGAIPLTDVSCRLIALDQIESRSNSVSLTSSDRHYVNSSLLPNIISYWIKMTHCLVYLIVTDERCRCTKKCRSLSHPKVRFTVLQHRDILFVRRNGERIIY